MTEIGGKNENEKNGKKEGIGNNGKEGGRFNEEEKEGNGKKANNRLEMRKWREKDRIRPDSRRGNLSQKVREKEGNEKKEKREKGGMEGKRNRGIRIIEQTNETDSLQSGRIHGHLNKNGQKKKRGKRWKRRVWRQGRKEGELMDNGRNGGKKRQ